MHSFQVLVQIRRRRYIYADSTECYSVYSEGKFDGDDQGDDGTYENEWEGHPCKAERCFECHGTHKTSLSEM